MHSRYARICCCALNATPPRLTAGRDSESALNVYYTLLYKNANTDASEGPLSKG